MFVPPWFVAPVGSTQWVTLIREPLTSGTTSHNLVFDTAGTIFVPSGYFAAVVAASIVTGTEDEDSVNAAFAWRLIVDSILQINRVPCSTVSMRVDGTRTAGGITFNTIMPAVAPLPILAPIIVEEGKGGRLQIFDDAGSGIRTVRHGWVTGWLCPRVNDRPGALSFLNQRA